MDLELVYFPLLPIVNMKKKINREVLKCYVHLFHYLGHNITNVRNCNRINVVMASPNCMNENLLEIVSYCVWNKV